MKEFNTRIDKKLYYFTMCFINLFMLMGLFVGNPLMSDFKIGYIVHLILVVILIILLLLYPRFETHKFRLTIIVGLSIYYYLLFFLYPETWTAFILIALIPALSILFFDSKLFYISLSLNGICVSMIFLYIAKIDKGFNFSHFQLDLVGNYITFIGSQLIIFVIHYLSYTRLKKMQLYYEKIQQSERLKATGQLAAAVAHEIRNPLTVVKGFLQFYENDKSFNSDTKKHFALMINELNTAEHVISQYLSIAKPSKEIETEIINIYSVLHNITELLQSYGILRSNKI